MKGGAFFRHGDFQTSCETQGSFEVRKEEVGCLLGHLHDACSMIVSNKTSSVSCVSNGIYPGLIGFVQQVDATLGDVQAWAGLKKAIGEAEGLGAV